MKDAWNDIVQEAVANVKSAPGSIQSHIIKIGTLTNVPRNEKKFKNFVKNSIKLFNDSLIDEIWAHICKYNNKSLQNESGTTRTTVNSSEVSQTMQGKPN